MAVFIRPPSVAPSAAIDSSAPALASSHLSAASHSPHPGHEAPYALAPAHARRDLSKDNGSGGLELYWGRLTFASVFLLVILIAGFVAALLGLKDWSTLLLHSFELLLGIFMGLLGGDIANRKAS